jgi:hypothetical protein
VKLWVFMFLASSSWCCPRHLLSKTCSKDVENSTQIDPRFRFMRCTPDFARYLFPSRYNSQHVRLGVDWLLPALSKGDVWSEGRKLLDRSLRPAAPISYRNMMEEKTRSFLGQLFLTPKHFRSHIELSALLLLQRRS